MSAIQFRSIGDTVAAYERLDCPVWSLWDGKRFMFKGEGADELRAFLDLMNNNGSTNAEYVLAYYEGVTDKSTVNSKTAFDGSFRFRLNSDGTEITTGQYRQIGSINEMQTKMSVIESKLDVLLSEETDDGDDGDGLGVIGQILGHPSIAPMIPVLVEKIMSSVFNPAAVQPAPSMSPLRKVSGIDPGSAAAHSDVVLQNAIDRLSKADPKLALHLTQLADLSERDPNSFNYVVKMLEQMQTT